MSKPLSPQLFAILSAIVEERLGIHYGVDDLELFSDKVGTRALDAGFENALDYYYYLRYDGAAASELDALADALVVGETYFFRELDALRAGIAHAVLPAISERGRARVWSAACATGEEAVSLSLLLDEAGIRDRTEIVATDVSARAIAKAREGSYSSRSLRALPPNNPPAAFTDLLGRLTDATILRQGQRAQVTRTVIDGIDYRQLNLLDDAAVAALGTFDLVLCRNVLIYFADATVKRVVGTLSRALRDDARLIIGASESLLRFGTMLRCEERGGAFLYGREQK
ncbi:MAG: chemotaxis protein CheR [Myxococcaceae bacterium]|nr:chemotaxis protein CheR [Myxococcaceae bacterium]MEA2751717.1 chemotaxis protein methyltransferase CheR [Myxococcales bacterium]